VTLQYLFSLFPRLALLLCLSSVLWPVAAQQAQARPGGRTICVASVIGHKLNVQTIGLMVFGNKLESATIRSWGIDSLVVHKLRARLGARFSVRPITLPAGALAGYVPAQGLFGGGRDNALKAALHSNTKAGCAYYAIATTFSGQFPGTNQYINGLGILKRDGIIENYWLFAVFAIRLYDGQSLESIRLPIDGAAIIAGALTGPAWLEKVDKAYWPVPAQSAARNGKLRGGIHKLVSKLVEQDAPHLIEALTRPAN
jgi:hypothetical protein